MMDNKRNLWRTANLLLSASILSVGVLLPNAYASSAQHEHDDEHQHDNAHKGSVSAHDHGLADMTFVLSGRELWIELNFPAHDVYGFEHSPKTPSERKQVAHVQRILENPQQLFTLYGGECKLTEYEGPEASEHHDSEHDADEHGHEMHHDDTEHEVHTEVITSYRYQCAQPQALSAIDMVLFSPLSEIQHIDLAWVIEELAGVGFSKTSVKQGKTELSEQVSRWQLPR